MSSASKLRKTVRAFHYEELNTPFLFEYPGFHSSKAFYCWGYKRAGSADGPDVFKAHIDVGFSHSHNTIYIAHLVRDSAGYDLTVMEDHILPDFWCWL